MKIINIAEKPSVARSISKILSINLKTTKGKHKYCPNIFFKYKNDEFVFTSVLGHLYNLSFCKKNQNWELINPFTLLHENVEKGIVEDFLSIKQNIENISQSCDKAIIWTDCDREGEHIAQQILNIINGIKQIEIKRARFSGISTFDIQNALDNLTNINLKEANAVDCRMELDLRTGSCFTILQTIQLKGIFNTKHVISFGPCQIPTLGFCVERYLRIIEFKNEKFYNLVLCTQDKWNWKRNNLFDKNCVLYFYNLIKGFKPLIFKKEIKEVKKFRPLPLRTVELQKICSSLFNLNSHKIMEISEKLYNKGYISYPRTETDTFSKSFNFKNVIEKLKEDDCFNIFCSNLAKSFKYPRSGKNNDMAHSPIYPLKQGTNLSGLDRLIYEFIARRFLGSICEDAKGIETCYECKIDKEIFSIKGLKITERNYLDVYIYDKWNNKIIDEYSENEYIQDFVLDIENGTTSPPSFLSESDLISLMDQNGIGTDATIHEHIKKIQERSYAIKRNNLIIPTKLGVGLINAYKALDIQVYKPLIRSRLETCLTKICNSEMTKEEVLSREIKLYEDIYRILDNKIDLFRDTIRDSLNTGNSILDLRGDDDGGKDGGEGSSGGNSGSNNNIRCSLIDGSKSNNMLAANNIRSSFTPGSDIFVNKQPPISNHPLSNISPSSTKITSHSKEDISKANIFCNNKTSNIFVINRLRRDTLPEEVKCLCGYEPKILVSYTEANKNRQFYKCKKVYKPCKFFKWVDE